MLCIINNLASFKYMQITSIHNCSKITNTHGINYFRIAVIDICHLVIKLKLLTTSLFDQIMFMFYETVHI